MSIAIKDFKLYGATANLKTKGWDVICTFTLNANTVWNGEPFTLEFVDNDSNFHNKTVTVETVKDSTETRIKTVKNYNYASMVAELRGKTDAPMIECKKALTEADGDMAKAEELLRVKLGTKAGKAASRVTAEGVVAYAQSGNAGALIEVNCETDFVTKNDSFLKMAQAAADLIARHNPADVAALGALAYEQDGFGPTLEDVRKGLIGKIGENMSFRRFKRFDGGAKLASYLHGTRIGVVVEFDGDEVAAKDVAMHVAAMKPAALTAADVPAELIEKERAVAAGKAEEDRKAAEAAGKPAQPADIVAKRIEGGVQKVLKEVSLYNQAFVKNDKQTVEQMLKEKATTVKSFTLSVVGEGIEKKTDDFAAEVAAQVAAAKAGA